MANQLLKPIAILGAGSWGTALALYLARRGQAVRIWSIESSEIEALQTTKTNQRYLPGHILPDSIEATNSLAVAIKDVEDVLVVVPSIGFRTTLMQLKPLMHTKLRIICATKGLDAKTGQLLDQVAYEILGKDLAFAVLSGPSFAKEVAAGLPAALALASLDPLFLQEVMARFNSPIFRIHPCSDIKGVEIGGIAKNVLAIATGISDGMHFGANARAALLTQGLAEMILLGKALGAELETFIGLSGLGDLILTATDDQSRNRRLGLSLGKGLSIAQAELEIGQAIEGKDNAQLIAHLAQKHQVKMPLCDTVWQILQGTINARDGIQYILSA
jgi:glycerol-3-phosphate dehydrogenase (NAD(P)+)